MANSILLLMFGNELLCISGLRRSDSSALSDTAGSQMVCNSVYCLLSK